VSYIRFSSKEQAKGDSERRQTEQAEAYCRRRGWTLDETLSLRDLGVSAFRGKNALVGNLGVFLEAVRRGTVAPGSALIVESIDRISRQGIDEGYDLIKSLLKAGIVLVTLSPEREFDASATRSLTRGALEIQLILERAAEESERKSERVAAARAQERARARATGKLITRRLPAWVREVGGRRELVPDRAEAVRRIFALAAGGVGIPGIIKKFAEDGVPAFGRSGRWTRAYVGLILKDRRALGELQPRRGKDADGPPLAYYPPVVSEREWLAARAGARERRKNPGRIGVAQVNVFARRLFHARDGDPYIMTQRLSRSPGRPTRKFQVLVNSEGDQGRGRAYSLPYDVFERAVGAALREIDPHDILNGDRPPDATAALAAELADAEAELAEAAAFMDANGFSEVIGRRVAALEAHQRELAAQLLEARETAVYPLSESWGEAQGLLATLDEAPDPREARLRLRSALRRILASARLLVVPRGQERLSAAQLFFTGGRCRSYLILSRPASGPRPAAWRVASFAAVHAPGALDLRDQTHTRRLEAWLAAVDVHRLWEALPESPAG